MPVFAKGLVRCKESGATHRARDCPATAPTTPVQSPAKSKRPREPTTTMKPRALNMIDVEVPPEDWATFHFEQALKPSANFELRTETGTFDQQSTCHCDVPVVSSALTCRWPCPLSTLHYQLHSTGDQAHTSTQSWHGRDPSFLVLPAVQAAEANTMPIPGPFMRDCSLALERRLKKVLF